MLYRPLANDLQLTLVWCVYPSKRVQPPPFVETDAWKSWDGLGIDTFSRELRQECRYPWRSIVLGTYAKKSCRLSCPGLTDGTVCGDTGFVDIIRTSVLENTTAERDITFVEAKFRPQGSEHVNHRMNVAA